MTFDEVLDQVRELLQQRRRVTYRSLKLRYQLDDEVLAGVTDELIRAERVAADEDGKVLVWTGSTAVVSDQLSVTSPQPLAPNTHHPDAPRAAEAERRQLTVMFCDLVGSTALSEQLDPEELREVVRTYQQTSAAVIERFGGHIAQYLGDGLLVYFGYPVAHEDDAARAVRAGLEIIEALQHSSHVGHEVPSPLVGEGQGEGDVGATGPLRYRETGAQSQWSPLQARIGIHTGLVVVGEMGGGDKREQLALGETPNIAARVQGLAEPDNVVMSAATYRLVQGLFECQDLGPQQVKGLSMPLSLYGVVRESVAQSRFDAAVQKGLTPFIGREREVGLLQERWDRAKQGEGQVVLLNGEPGIGKSRLVQELKERLGKEGTARIEFHCSPYHQNSALYPIIDHLQRMLQFAREDSPATKLEKLQHTLSYYRFPQADTLPLLAALLSLPHPEGAPPLTLSPQKQKQKTQEALVAWIVEEADTAPVYCAWEDLHWADPSTLEWLTLYLDQIPTTRMFTVLTFRPDFTPPWGVRSYLSQLTLSRLGRQQVGAMVEKVTGGKPLPLEVMQQIVSKTDGVPLFVEELTKMVVESELYVGATHASPLPPLAIPATLHDALMARLDRLAEAKAVAQLGATLGREFSYELLQAMSSVDEATLQRGLAQLVDAELVYQRGLPPQAHYIFKHALIQDTAYQSLLKRERQRLHQQIAHVLVERFLDTAATQPELVAHHYTEAGLIEQAIPYWQQAGERAVDRSAYVEAISHLSTGLELLKTLPETVEHLHQELNLQTPLGLAFMATKWYGAPEVGQAYARARELCRQLGETPQIAQALYGLWVIHLVWGELPTAYEAAEQLLRLGQNTQDPALMVEGHHGLGQISYYMGKFAAARDHLEQAIALYDSRQPSSHAIRPIQDPGVLSRGYAAWSLWFLGYPDQALQRVHEAFALAQKLSHPLSFGFALNFASTLHQFRKEEQLAQEWAEAVRAFASERGSLPSLFYYSGRKSTFMAFASEHDFTQFVARGTFMRGSMLADQGQVAEGLTQLRQSINTYLAGGTELLRPIFLSGLAAAHGTVGQIDEGLTLVTEALAVLNKAGQRLNEAGLYLLKGQLTLQKFQVSSSKFQVDNPQSAFRNPQLEAEACFLKALDVARHQGAKSLELQAAMSLARLWQQQGKRYESHEMLSDIYNWFTEGFDTKDLQEAKALLDSLGSGVQTNQKATGKN